MNSILENPLCIKEFQNSLLKWGNKNLKNYPWRFCKNPYKILVSEIMLMRTKAEQVLPVYKAFINQYPTIEKTITSSDQDLLKILYPLGLNWRIQKLINILREISTKYDEFPSTFEALISIDGIGSYIAGSTICFSQNKPEILIDTNIVKVIGRVCGLDLRGEARRRKEIFTAIQALVSQEEPAKFYYCLIDLSHSICVNKNPNCNICPLRYLPCNYFSTSENQRK